MDARFICLEDEAFYALVEKVVTHVKDKFTVKEDKWISGDEAMRKLHTPVKLTQAGRFNLTQFGRSKLTQFGRFKLTHPGRSKLTHPVT